MCGKLALAGAVPTQVVPDVAVKCYEALNVVATALSPLADPGSYGWLTVGYVGVTPICVLLLGYSLVLSYWGGRCVRPGTHGVTTPVTVPGVPAAIMGTGVLTTGASLPPVTFTVA